MNLSGFGQPVRGPKTERRPYVDPTDRMEPLLIISYFNILTLNLHRLLEHIGRKKSPQTVCFHSTIRFAENILNLILRLKDF